MKYGKKSHLSNLRLIYGIYTANISGCSVYCKQTVAVCCVYIRLAVLLERAPGRDVVGLLLLLLLLGATSSLHYASSF